MQASDLPNRRILVVDDNRAAVHLLGRLLASLRQEVRAATSGAKALETAFEFAPHVVISDIAMPDMSGYELARRIRQQQIFPQPVLIALTGYGQAADRQAAFDAGFDQHLTKPISLDQLTRLLHSLSATLSPPRREATGPEVE